jgi:hypothetical protein
MSEHPEKDHALQQLLDDAFQHLPARRAPRDLESRVMRELERRAALPWWRKTFAHWPAAARGAFVLTCSGLIGLMLLGGHWTATTVHTLQGSAAMPLSVAREAMALFTATGELAVLLANAIPAAWLYVGLATGAVLYAVLFGLGAAAYRTLYLTPLNGK